MLRLLRGFVITAVAMAAAVMVISRVTRAAEPTYHVVENWAPLAGMEWGEVTGVAMGRQGQIYALRRGEPPVIELDPSGKVLRTWGQNMFVWPHGLPHRSQWLHLDH